MTFMFPEKKNIIELKKMFMKKYSSSLIRALWIKMTIRQMSHTRETGTYQRVETETAETVQWLGHLSCTSPMQFPFLAFQKSPEHYRSDHWV